PSEVDGCAAKPRGNGRYVAALREVQHGCIGVKRAKAHSKVIDGELHRERQLMLTALGYWNASAGFENPLVEEPAVHAHRRMTQRGRLGVARLLHDTTEDSLDVDVEKRVLRDPLRGNLSVANQTVTAECRQRGRWRSTELRDDARRVVVVRVH